MKQYDKKRPSIPAKVRREVEVEAEHSCSVKGCHEHTYLEIHHINKNREDNKLQNLILLCDKHHKMAHKDIIDRKSLQEYKNLLNKSFNKLIDKRFAELLKINQIEKAQLAPEPTQNQPTNEDIKIIAPGRTEILKFVLLQVTISHYENKYGKYFERQVEFIRGKDNLHLDALRQDDDLKNDIIIEFQHIRRTYMDAPVYGEWLEKKIELYELLTGRSAIGILLIVVGRDNMKDISRIPMTIEGLKNLNKSISYEIFTYSDIGFKPSPISAALSIPDIKANKTLEKNL